MQPEQRSMQHTCQGSTYVPFLLLTYSKITYFALGRISWPFLYHLSSTVGSASSTMNLTLPPLSTWYAGSRPLAKAVVEAKSCYKRRSENKNMNDETALHKSHQSCQNVSMQCYAFLGYSMWISLFSRNIGISVKLCRSHYSDQGQTSFVTLQRAYILNRIGQT